MVIIKARNEPVQGSWTFVGKGSVFGDPDNKDYGALLYRKWEEDEYFQLCMKSIFRKLQDGEDVVFIFAEDKVGQGLVLKEFVETLEFFFKEEEPF